MFMYVKIWWFPQYSKRFDVKTVNIHSLIKLTLRHRNGIDMMIFVSSYEICYSTFNNQNAFVILLETRAHLLIREKVEKISMFGRT